MRKYAATAVGAIVLSSLLMTFGVTAVSAAGEPSASHFRHAAAPSVAWHFRNKNATVNASSRVFYAVTNAPVGARIALQRAAGTAHVWKRVVILHRGRGSVLVPGLPAMGRYLYRIAVYGPKHPGHPRRLLSTSKHYRYVFRSVKLGTMLGSTPQSVVVAGQDFRYVWYDYHAESWFEFGQTTSTCRSISLDIAIQDDGYIPDSFSIYHESSDPTSVTGNVETIISLDSTLARGQSWAFEADMADNTFYVNGTASCYSTAQVTE